MILSELIRRFRVAAFDNEQPYLFADEDITDWLNDAVKEAAIRGRLIHDSTTTGVCAIATVPNVSIYALHESLYEIDSLRWVSTVSPERSEPIYLTSQEDMGGIWHDWRTRDYGTPEYAIQHDTNIRLVPAPNVAGEIALEGYRTPLVPMLLDTDRPEINIIHHEYLIHWALHKGFGIPDSEVFDMNRSALAEQEFTDYFGQRPDSDLRRITREDVPHTVKPFWV
jgi:hypothetical protein